jgi:hypothetical protein
MKWIPIAAKQNATRVIALLAILSLYGLAQLPQPSELEIHKLSSQFKFTQSIIPEAQGFPLHSIRDVNPSLEHISAWISSVGAGVALNDFDSDGLANDLCLVDPRTDQVTISPAPGTGARYETILLSAAMLGFDRKTMAPMGCLPGDFNEDGFMDALVYYWGRTPVIFLKAQDGFLPTELVITGERWFTNAATSTDLDGDGHLDLVIGNYFQDNARILDASEHTNEQMQASMSRAFNAGSTRFLLWQGTEKRNHIFKDVAGGLDAKARHGWTLAIGAADLDGDLLPEIYLANDFGPDRLLHNNSTPGHLSFTLLEGQEFINTPSSKRVGLDSFKGMGVDFADLNGDKILDIYVSNIAAEYALEESHFAFISTGNVQAMRDGIAPYVDQSEELGLSRSNWSWEARLADFNNDGNPEALQATGFVKGEIDRWPELQELAIGNDDLLHNPDVWLRVQPGDDLSGYAHNPFFVRTKSGRFVDIAADINLDAPQVSRGIATADVDGDGDLDFAVANQWEPSRFYRNDCPRCGDFLGLRLLLPLQDELLQVTTGLNKSVTPSRPAIGAEAQVTLSDGRVLVAQVDGGNGHSGKRSPDLHFGLGKSNHTQPVRVELRWRDINGNIHKRKFKLQSGWHTVVLGSAGNKEV